MALSTVAADEAELSGQLVAGGGVLGSAARVVDTPGIQEGRHQRAERDGALLAAFLPRPPTAHLSLLLVGQHTIHPLSIFIECIHQGIDLLRQRPSGVPGPEIS